MYPILFRIGDIAISSYMVTMSIAFLVAYILCKGEFKRRGLSEDLLDLLLVANVLGVVVWAKKVYFWLAADAMAPSLVIGYAIAKIGCFLVGDDYGIPSNLPWAMS